MTGSECPKNFIQDLFIGKHSILSDPRVNNCKSLGKAKCPGERVVPEACI